MRARYANEMTDGCSVDATFVVDSKEVRIARNGDPYLSLRLADRSGSLGAVFFRPSATASAIPAGSVVQVSGAITTYRGRRLLEIRDMTPAESWDPADLARAAARPEQELQEELTQVVRSVKATDMRRLLRVLFGDKDAFSRFSSCPATASGHHAHLNGLLEHTLATALLCDAMCERYDRADRDLLVTAALVHDIGVIDELDWTAGITVTDHGRLVGHVVSGLQRIHVAAQKAKLAPHRLAELEHAVASHHCRGQHADHDQAPSTLEALLLCQADQLDAAVVDFCDASSRAQRADEHWTSASNQLGRPIRVPGGEVKAGSLRSA